MFVYYFTTLGVPFESVAARLTESLTGFNDLAGAAYREGEEIRARIGPRLDQRLLAKTIRLQVGEPTRSVLDLTVPLVWEATGARVLFPRMEADLVLVSMGPDLTQLTFRGTYQPPLGALGRAMDRTILHRVAESSVRGFVERVAEAMTKSATGARSAEASAEAS